MRLKVVCNGLEDLGATRVCNAETGEPIDGVRAVRFLHEPGDLPSLLIDVHDFDYDLEADAALSNDEALRAALELVEQLRAEIESLRERLA